MLKIECLDDEKGFSMSIELSGQSGKIAQELNSVLNEINRRCPIVIETLLYLRDLKLENPEVND